MEGLKESGTNLLQERPHNGKKVVQETHHENKSNVNHDFIESNVIEHPTYSKDIYEEVLSQGSHSMDTTDGEIL